MKKLALFPLLLSLFSCGSKAQIETPVCGGYGDVRPLTEEESQMFDNLFKDSTDVIIKAVNVSSQVVAGMNYEFQCERMNADSTWSSLIVKVFKPLSKDEEPIITYMSKGVPADETGYIVEVGDEAPDFKVTTDDGQTIRLSDLRGKVVMLQFTASWCSVCRREMPFIERDIWQKHKKNKKFVLIGIDRDEPLETVKAFKEKTGVTYPLGLDPAASIYSRYALKESGITRNVLIDKNGKIVKLTRLYNEDEFASLVDMINKML